MCFCSFTVATSDPIILEVTVTQKVIKKAMKARADNPFLFKLTCEKRMRIKQWLNMLDVRAQPIPKWLTGHQLQSYSSL